MGLNLYSGGGMSDQIRVFFFLADMTHTTAKARSAVDMREIQVGRLQRKRSDFWIQNAPMCML